jgi:hypothetical protein
MDDPLLFHMSDDALLEGHNLDSTINHPKSVTV